MWRISKRNGGGCCNLSSASENWWARWAAHPGGRTEFPTSYRINTPTCFLRFLSRVQMFSFRDFFILKNSLKNKHWLILIISTLWYWRLKIEGCKWPLHIYYWFFASLTLSRTSENFTISHWNALLRDFDEFVQKFQKKYATSEEYESTFSCHIKCFYYGWARKRIFENNRRKIRAHNALNGTSS